MTSFSLDAFYRAGSVISLSNSECVVGWGTPNRGSNRTLDPLSPMFSFPHFFLSEYLIWHQHPYTHLVEMEYLRKLLEPIPNLTSLKWQHESFPEFYVACKPLQNDIQRDLFHKGVPYCIAYAPEKMTGDRFRSTLAGAIMAAQQGIGYLYGHWENGQGVLGVTPEVLFTHSEQHPYLVHTMALAGTASDIHVSSKAFQCDAKETWEHQIVVQAISEAMKSLGSVTIAPQKLYRAGELTHLLTPISVTLSDSFSFDTCLQLLHPTPALGAFPMEAGWKWLKGYDDIRPRRRYGAPICIKIPEHTLSSCFVGIRNVQWDRKGMYLMAGAGVVAQSDIEQEYREICKKMNSIQRQLRL